MDPKHFEKLESMIKTAYNQETPDVACNMNDKSIGKWRNSNIIDINAYRALIALNTVYYGFYKTMEVERSM